MKTDTQIYGYVKEVKENLNKYIEITIWKRLIEEEIICYELEDKGVTSLWLDIDKKW